MPADGQRANRALDWATLLLQRSGMRGGQILLLTDQVDDDAVAAAAQAHAQGMRVSVLGLGTPAGAAYRDGRGQISNAALDEKSLSRLAAAGGGRYQRLARDGTDLQALGVLQADQVSGEQERGSARHWLDQGYWLLPPVMLLALLAFRRRAAMLSVLVLMGGATMLPLPLQAQENAATGLSAQAVTATPWLRLDQRQQQRLEQGVRAYQQGDFGTAARQFEAVDNAEGWYNLGNARARQGDLDGAIQAYDRALSQRPGMEDAVANRAVVDAARKRRKPPGAGAGTSPPSQGKKGQQQAGQGRPSGQPPAQPPKASGTPGAGAPPPPPPQSTPANAPSSTQQGQSAPQQKPSADPQAQARADAEQRQRMQQAMKDGQGEGDGKQAQPAPRTDGRTPQQREQQQAVDAWMRRVPDQPGDLLRAKFQLETERRKREGP